MRQVVKVLAGVAVVAAIAGTSVAQAAFFSYPRLLTQSRPPAELNFDNPVLAPMAHVRFCLRYEDDCRVQGADLRRPDIQLTAERLEELNTINHRVNRDIIPQADLGGVANEQWHIAPAAGDCADYAVTKRHLLLARGWPSRSLLLSEVVVPSGEHHLVLVVRTADGDVVLDNLNATIRPLAMMWHRYRWLRIESPSNPKFWASLEKPAPMLVAKVEQPLRQPSRIAAPKASSEVMRVSAAELEAALSPLRPYLSGLSREDLAQLTKPSERLGGPAFALRDTETDNGRREQTRRVAQYPSVVERD